MLENADGQLFLLSDQNLDVFQYHTDNESVTWETSTMRSWLNGYDASHNTGGDSGIDYTSDNFIGTAFSAKEQAAIADTEVFNDDNPTYGTEGGNNTTDQIFLLSIAEAQNSSYFADNSSRIATNTAYVAGGGKLGSSYMNGVGEADYWWLRSPGDLDHRAAGVSVDGGVGRYGHSVRIAYNAVRPAFNLDLTSVLFTSAAVGGKIPAASSGGNQGGEAADAIFEIGDYDGSEWKLTLLDNSRNFAVTEEAASGKPGDTITLNYTGATTGTNEYISAIIADNNGAQYYGRVAQPTATDGKVEITIPSGLADGTYTQYVFSEQYNGGEQDDTKLTDYASAFETVALTVSSDTTASPAALDFGSKTVGYTEAPAAQTVTLTNTGNQNVTVTLPASANYTITAGEGFANSTATLAPNGTAAFTVQPNTGLTAGDYDEELTISGTNGASCTVQLRFAVTKKSVPVSTYTITVEDTQHGRVTSSASRASRNTTVTLTAAADEGYQMKSLTVTDSGGKEIELTDKGNGMFTFIMPAGNVTVKAVFLPDYAACDGGDACPLAAYTDLNTGAWYHNGTHYCLDEGLMIGTGENAFSPDGTLTRAQAVTVLWRMENEPVVNYAMSFADVAEGQWYTEAVRWAASEKIVEGYSDTEFGTDDAITREQLATILSRYAAYKGYDVSADGELGVFTDASEISDWAYAAMQWACGTGLMEGDAGILNPTGDTRRCEFATMVMRFAENIAE